MVLLIDNYDSFTYNLYQAYLRTGAGCTVVCSDEVEVEAIRALNPQLIVISPGPGGPESTGSCPEVIRRYAGQIPIFGVCLGMQTLAAVHGAQIVEALAPVHGKLSTVTHDDRGVFAGTWNPRKVTRYHSLVVKPDTLPPGWTITARTSDKEVMGLRHQARRLEGVQFHPEALLTECGQKIVENSLKL